MSLSARSWSWPSAPSVPLGADGSAMADRWVKLLGIAMLGYAVAGRGFAYLGVPPVFIGELVLLSGLLIALWDGALFRAFTLAPLKLYAALLVWVVIRTVPYLGVYGVDAIRDAMVVGYGLYAVAVFALLTAKPERLLGLIRGYRVLVVVVVATGWIIYLVGRQFPTLFPIWPWSADTRIIEVKGGDLQVHLAAITAFLVLGFRKARAPLLVLLLFGVGIGMIGNRGGMVGYMLAMGVLFVMKPKTTHFGKLGLVGVVIVGAALLVDTSKIQTNEGNRSLSVQQIWENVESVFGGSDQRMLNTTAEWRKQWWTEIFNYTFNGPYFWTGKGFGINLATADGFRVDEEQSLRSPHNSHFTMLARGGVPAFVMWLLMQGGWFLSVGWAWWQARQARQARWMGVYTVCVVYCVAALLNASFDVHLEGPMGAIPYWTFFGIAMAAVYIRPRRPELLDELEEGPPAIAPDPAPSWGWNARPVAAGAA